MSKNILQVRIAQMLEQRGMSQNEASRRSGASLGLVRDIVSGKVESPRWDSIVRIADVLNVSPEYLIGRIDDFWPATKQISAREVPVVGQCAVGSFVDPEQEMAGRVVIAAVDPRYKDSPTIAYKVADKSFLDVCPMDGHVICVRYSDLRTTPHEGDIVVVEMPLAGTGVVERRIGRYKLVAGSAVLESVGSQPGLKLAPAMTLPAFVIGSVWRPA